MAFALFSESPDLKIPEPTNTPSTPICIIKAASAGVAIPPAAKLTTGNSQIMLAVKSGKAIRFEEEKVRPMGRTASGVRGVTLASENDEVIGIIIIDHGSRRATANNHLLTLVEKYKSFSNRAIVEPAHMELGEPSIDTAYKKCIAQGAKRLIIHPFFLSPGRHVLEDIPELVKQASEAFDVPYTITDPLGVHGSILNVIDDIITKEF